MRLLRRKIQGSLLILLWFPHAVAANPKFRNQDPIGIVWIKARKSEVIPHRLQEEREMVDQLENQLGRRAVKSANGSMIPVETFRLAKTNQKLKDHVDRLSKIAFGVEASVSSANDSAKAWIQDLNRLAAQLPKGTFGPELQRARLVQAAWSWREGNKKMFERLCVEAAKMHPLRKVDFEPFHDEPLAHLVEGDCLKTASKERESLTCEVDKKDEIPKIQDVIWINGFKLESRNIRVYPGNYVLIQRNPQGRIFEKVLRCGQQGFSGHAHESWIPVKGHLRMEYLIPSEFEKLKELVILSEESEKIRKYHLRNLTDLSDWNPEVDGIPLRWAPETSFESSQSEQWYNKSQFWWVAGAVVGAGAFVISKITENNRPRFLNINFKYGP